MKAVMTVITAMALAIPSAAMAHTMRFPHTHSGYHQPVNQPQARGFTPRLGMSCMDRMILRGMAHWDAHRYCNGGN